MELRRLRYFLATADELSFRRAADVIGVNQSAVSRQIAALEDELGVTLFEHRSTGARLTEVGRVFLADARKIVTDVDRTRETVRAVAFGMEGRLRLAICEDCRDTDIRGDHCCSPGTLPGCQSGLVRDTECDADSGASARRNRCRPVAAPGA
ncbi:LysR family transcriptional regulator [Rhodobacteraceae bacterium CCMM004]|nr:LysR family transcriptional regulator [Rhodobacteraceae bacterium CCMM004]